MPERKEIFLKNLGLEPNPNRGDLLPMLAQWHDLELRQDESNTTLIISERTLQRGLFPLVKHALRPLPDAKTNCFDLLKRELSTLEV